MKMSHKENIVNTLQSSKKPVSLLRLKPLGENSFNICIPAVAKQNSSVSLLKKSENCNADVLNFTKVVSSGGSGSLLGTSNLYNKLQITTKLQQKPKKSKPLVYLDVPSFNDEVLVDCSGSLLEDSVIDVCDNLQSETSRTSVHLDVPNFNDEIFVDSSGSLLEASVIDVQDRVTKILDPSETSKNFDVSESDSDLSDDDFVKKKRKRTLESSLNEPGVIVAKRKRPNCRKKQNDRSAYIEAAVEKSKSFTKISDILPSSFDYVIVSLEESQDNPNEWKAIIRVSLKSKEEAEDWMCEFQQLSNCDYRIRDVKKENTQRLVFKKIYRCHHNIPQAKKDCNSPSQTFKEDSNIPGKKSKPRVSKNTNCPASMRVTIKQTGMKWSSDDLLEKYPCEILLNFNHNHHLLIPKALGRRRPTPAIEDKFRELFKNGHSPSSAHELHKFDLQMQFNNEEYVTVAADRSKNPDVKWVFRLYYKIYQKHYGASHGEGMVTALQDFIRNYNEAQGSTCVASQVVFEKHLVVAVCTPLMQRVHERLRSAGEIMFVDSSGTMDALNTRVFLLLCPSIAGGLPLGILLVSSEAEVVLKSALDLWMTLLPDDEKAFGGRGSKGPKIIMTDDCSHERNALKSCFPEARLLLCLFHVLQAFWSYVWKADHKVSKDDRGAVYFSFRDIVYASEEEVFEAMYAEMLNLPSVSNNSILKKHLVDFKPRAKEWALYMRSDLLTRGHNTDNYSEAGMRLLKDKVCRRVKAFSPVQLLDFILTRFVSYLERRIVDVINDRQENVQRSRYFISPDKLKPLRCYSLPSPHLYKVKNVSQGTEYVVNMLDELCTCPVGHNGAPCKHQYAVVKHFKLPSSQIINAGNDPQIKKDLLYIVYGASAKLPPNWFSDLRIDVNDSQLYDEETSSRIQEAETVVDQCSLPHINVNDVGPTDIASTSFSSEEIGKLEEDLKVMVDGWISSLRSRPDVFMKPCAAMVKRNQLLSKTDSALTSAMHTFGKSDGTPSFSCAGTKKVPVNSTSVKRRTAFLGGRNVQITGRPPKAINRQVPEHNFSVPPKVRPQEAAACWATPPARKVRVPAPHSLQTCVERNIPLGKTHQKK